MAAGFQRYTLKQVLFNNRMSKTFDDRISLMGRNRLRVDTCARLLGLIIKKHQKNTRKTEDFCSGLSKPSWHARARNHSSKRFSVWSLAAGFRQPIAHMDDRDRGGNVCEGHQPAFALAFRDQGSSNLRW